MNFWIPIYIVFYCCWSLLGILDDRKANRPKVVIGIDTLVAIVSVFGMWLFYRSVNVSEYLTIWKIVFIIVLAWELGLAWCDIKLAQQKGNPQLTGRENIILNVLGVFLGMILFVPCGYMLYQLAFSS